MANDLATDAARNETERRLLAVAKPRLRVFDDDALNAEPAAHMLDEPITRIEHFFIRNNGYLPDLPERPAEHWVLKIEGEVRQSRRWSLHTLRTEFETVTQTAVLECAGYAREDFTPPTDGLPWGRGPIGCARWTGVRLADLLAACGAKPNAVYTGHHSDDLQTDGSGLPAISRGIPIEKAMAKETLLAFEMNGGPLPFLHGGPLRLVVPGFPGSAWQKWLTRIEVRDREHDGEKMFGTDYRLPRMPVAPGQTIDERDFEVIVNMPVNSLITAPAEGFTVKSGEPIEIRGFAWSGHTPVESVSVSADGGATWAPAAVEEAGDSFAWRRFRATVDAPEAGPVTVMARAADRESREQPLQAPWNPRGYCNNAVHRVQGTSR